MALLPRSFSSIWIPLCSPGVSSIWAVLHPVNDHDTHYSITLIKATQIDDLLNDINNAGWTKVRPPFFFFSFDRLSV